MGINYPVVTEIGYKTFMINEFGLDCCYLLEGSEKALLIDTGTGTFRLDELVRSMTDKPLMVALTHGHVDHAGGIGLFDKVFCHPDDWKAAKSITFEHRKEFAALRLARTRIAFDKDVDSMPRAEKLPEFEPIRGGDVIELGGRTIEVYDTPGHSAGSVSFLDKKERLIFTGDACNAHTLLITGDQGEKKMTVSNLLASAEKLESLKPYYDRNYSGHIGFGGNMNALSQPESVNRDCMALCRGLLDGTIQGSPLPQHGLFDACLTAEYNGMHLEYYDRQVK